MTKLEAYYNKFNEDKRLLSRHGQVEFHTTMHYIRQYARQLQAEGGAPLRVIDIGAGTGRYSVALAAEGYDVTAVEPVKWKPAILGWLTTYLDMSPPVQGTKLMTPAGRPHHWSSFM